MISVITTHPKGPKLFYKEDAIISTKQILYMRVKDLLVLRDEIESGSLPKADTAKLLATIKDDCDAAVKMLHNQSIR